jgi:2-methylisocitrate lyase-like PEP mutase family enzyme
VEWPAPGPSNGDTVTVVSIDRTEDFRRLHQGTAPLLLPNPWDAGSARLLASLGFAALATTSGGFAATLGRLDGAVTRDEALDHAATVVAATTVPVTADLENAFADDPAGVADTIRRAIDTGLAGCSVEDFTRRCDQPIYPLEQAKERIRAAVEAADRRLVLTARAENYLHGHPDLADTIDRLLAYQEVGADVLYAPGLTDLSDIRTLVDEVDRPVNVLLMAGGPSVAELAQAGVARISIGGRFAFAALGAVVEAARELLAGGQAEFGARAALGVQAAKAAFGP